MAKPSVDKSAKKLVSKSDKGRRESCAIKEKKIVSSSDKRHSHGWIC